MHLRRKRRRGPVQLAARVGAPASTVHRILVRNGVNRLDHMDRVTGEVIRYERERPGDLLHTDVKEFACVPGGGWKVHGRGFVPGSTWRTNQDHAKVAAARGTGKAGYAYVHSVIDDHSRLAFSEVHDDETTTTVVGFWLRAIAFFTEHGITVRQVLTDNGPAYRSNLFATLTAAQHVQRFRTRPYQPQTNGKVERYRDHARRTGIRQGLHLRISPPQRLDRMAAHLQPSPTTHRTRRQATRQPRSQRAWAELLGVTSTLRGAD